MRMVPGAWIAAACALFVALPSNSQRSQGTIDDITVTGERPGPGLWRATKDDHVLWLLGILQPLPKRMRWHSAQVEAVVAQSELVLPSRPSISLGVGPFAMIGLYFDWRRTAHAPGGATLREQVPEPLYQRFESLRQAYAPDDSSLENLRPIAAAQKLFELAVSASGLVSDDEVEKAVLRLARRHHVPIREDQIRIEDPKGLLAELRTIPLDSELRCLEATVARLETDLPALRQRAVAWAVGDVAALRELPSATRRIACWEAVEMSSRLRGLANAARAHRAATIEEAVSAHRQSLVLVPVDQLLAPDGMLATLRARGFQVDEP